MKIAIAGCGALGSQIALGIATPDIELTLFDFDVVDENNVITGTSAYFRDQIGVLKTHALAGMLYNKYGCEAECRNKRVENAQDFLYFDLIVDCFDNAMSRARTHHHNAIHIGVSPQFVGSVTWNEVWQLPTNIDEENEICTHQLGRNILTLTAAVAIVIINHWIETSERINRATKRWDVF